MHPMTFRAPVSKINKFFTHQLVPNMEVSFICHRITLSRSFLHIPGGSFLLNPTKTARHRDNGSDDERKPEDE